MVCPVLPEIKVTAIIKKGEFTYVTPAGGVYDKIYRAAKGVYWDEQSASLFYKGTAPQETALKIIAEAIKDEYGVILIYD